MAKAPSNLGPRSQVQRLEDLTIRFAGDAGDGMQLAGVQFTHASVAAGNDLRTIPDYPAEIRAPVGTLAGVSGFQVHISSLPVHTPGDVLGALVAMNPASLQTNLPDLEPGGVLIVNSDAFTPPEWRKAGFLHNPLEDGSLANYRVFAIPMTKLHREALAKLTLSPREIERSRNYFALGLVCWLYDRPTEPTLKWIREKFSKNPAALDGNSRSLMAGFQHSENSGIFPVRYTIGKAPLKPGRYRRVNGSEALGLGLVAAARKADLPLVFAAFPNTWTSDLFQQLMGLERFDVRCIQAEDAISAAGMALGSAFGGALGVTAASGPGLCLKSETIGLAVMTELPLVVIDMQRVGPSQGMPSKSEQGDLLQAFFGRNGESPVAVLAPCSPADCFMMAYESLRIASQFMTPVILLVDGHASQGAEPWKIPAADSLTPMVIPRPSANELHFEPYARDERLVRSWASPGMAGFEHRTGGLEKEERTGHVHYDPVNHERMVQLRAQKIRNIADAIPELTVTGPGAGDVLVIGWGSTCGVIEAAVKKLQAEGKRVAGASLRYVNPFPRNTGSVLKQYTKVLVPELNSGQLRLLLRSEFLVDAVGLNKVQGRPFLLREIVDKVNQMLHQP